MAAFAAVHQSSGACSDHNGFWRVVLNGWLASAETVPLSSSNTALTADVPISRPRYNSVNLLVDHDPIADADCKQLDDHSSSEVLLHLLERNTLGFNHKAFHPNKLKHHHPGEKQENVSRVHQRCG